MRTRCDKIRGDNPPDFLTIYKPFANLKPLLSEIKYKADLELHQSEYKPKFDAAINFACENGYQFSVITEDEIRTIHLQNAAFLNRYVHEEIDIEYASSLLARLLTLKTTTPEILLSQWSSSINHKGKLLYSLWQLVANKQINCDLSLPIAMNSKIWINPS